jgi:hypothetical protein
MIGSGEYRWREFGDGDQGERMVAATSVASSALYIPLY